MSNKLLSPVLFIDTLLSLTPCDCDSPSRCFSKCCFSNISLCCMESNLRVCAFTAVLVEFQVSVSIGTSCELHHVINSSAALCELARSRSKSAICCSKPQHCVRCSCRVC